jgi:hypothetical protein
VTATAVSTPFGLDPTTNDRGSWGASLLYNAELVMEVLRVAGGASVIEVGALDGDLTRLLLIWAQASGAEIVAVDPLPHADLETLVRDEDAVQLVREPSLEALTHVPLADTIILDGDHNYYTVAEELRIIAERAAAEQRPLPLLLLHDVGWPHGRRDDYYVPEQIPAEHRQPIAREGCLHPDEPGTRPGALPYHNPAAREGGARNGVLTALEDFVAGREELALAIVPTFFGMGVVWEQAAPYSEALSAVLAAWNRNPHIERLERNRVLHLANTQLQLTAIRQAEQRLAGQVSELTQQRQLLERLLQSRAFALIERVLTLLGRTPPFTREAIHRALRESDPPEPA